MNGPARDFGNIRRMGLRRWLAVRVVTEGTLRAWQTWAQAPYLKQVHHTLDTMRRKHVRLTIGTCSPAPPCIYLCTPMQPRKSGRLRS